MRSILLIIALSFATIAFTQTPAPSKEEVNVRALLAKNKPYKAITRCDHLITRKHRNEFYALRADGLNRTGNYAQAERDARSGLGFYPDNAEARFQLAIAEYGQGAYDSAMVHLRRVLKTDRSHEVRYRTALTYQKLKNYRDALLQLDQALVEGAKDTPDAAKFHRVKGECLVMRNDTLLARMEFDQAVTLGPEDPVNFNSRGFFLFAHYDQHVRAIADYDRSIKLDPNYSYAFNNRGWSLYKLGQKDRGLKDIRLAGRKKKNSPFVYRNLGIIALESGDTTLACTWFRQAIEYQFTALYGDEVEELMKLNCGHEHNATLPVQAPNAPMDNPAQPKPTRSNAP